MICLPDITKNWAKLCYDRKINAGLFLHPYLSIGPFNLYFTYTISWVFKKIIEVFFSQIKDIFNKITVFLQLHATKQFIISYW